EATRPWRSILGGGMTAVSRLRQGSNGQTNDATTADDRPKLVQPYLDWLEETWQGDMRELRKGRYLHQQADLRHEFETSRYWLEVAAKLPGWADSYRKKTRSEEHTSELQSHLNIVCRRLL